MEGDGQRHVPVALRLEKRPGRHRTEGSVVPMAGLNGCRKSHPHRDSIPWPSSPQKVAILTKLSRPTFTKTKTNLNYI